MIVAWIDDDGWNITYPDAVNSELENRSILPVRELALELFLGCPERVAYLLARLLESVAREAEDGWTVFRTEATQAAGHEGRLGR